MGLLKEDITPAPNTVALFKKIFRRLKPTENISVAEWADKYRRLPAESSSEPGKWKTSRTPYLKKPMECVSDPKVRKVTLMTSAQVGKSELIINSMGYYVDNDPSPMLLVQPTVDVGRDFSKERIAPTIRDTPVLRSAIGTGKSRNAKNTITKKFFPGGYLAIVGANSPVGLASRPIKVLFLDEVDRFPESAKKEGDPVTIVEKRTNTYPYNHKIIKVSTPTIDGASRIQYEYNQGTMSKWELPCPSCGEYHELQWANIKFDHIRNEDGDLIEGGDVLCLCPSCGELSNEVAWKSGSENGRWTDAIQDATHKSFRLSALASPWREWRAIVKAFLEAKSDSEMLKVWTNTELGEAWLEDGETIEFSELANRRVPYAAPVPNGVLVLTAGVDVQDDRFELEIVGWGVNKVSWGIEYKVIYGDTSLPETWERLDQHLLKVYGHEDGGTMQIMRVAVDSGDGDRTAEVYNFCKPRENRGVYAIKGKGGAGMNIIHTFGKTKKVKNTLFTIATNTAKSILYTRLAQIDEEKAGYCHFPLDTKTMQHGYDEKYFEGLTSEIKITKMVKGRPKTEWVVKNGTRNEPLDCRVYATAALEILNPNFEELKKRRVRGNKKQTSQKRRGAVRSGGVQD